jgi:hypothetical protein
MAYPKKSIVSLSFFRFQVVGTTSFILSFLRALLIFLQVPPAAVTHRLDLSLSSHAKSGCTTQEPHEIELNDGKGGRKTCFYHEASSKSRAIQVKAQLWYRDATYTRAQARLDLSTMPVGAFCVREVIYDSRIMYSIDGRRDSEPILTWQSKVVDA